MGGARALYNDRFLFFPILLATVLVCPYPQRLHNLLPPEEMIERREQALPVLRLRSTFTQT